MLSPDEIDKIKNAIANAACIEHVERLERALEKGKLDSVLDLVGNCQLSSLWDPSKDNSLIENVKAKHPATESVPIKKTPRQEIEEEQAKRRFKESARLSDIVCDSIFPRSTAGTVVPNESGWTASSESSEGKKRIVGVECATGIFMKDGAYVRNVLIRLLVTDFLTDRVLIDLDVAIPTDHEPGDLFPSLSGLEEPAREGNCLSEVRERLLGYISKDTIIISFNAAKSAQALQLSHSKWISVQDLFQVDPEAKKKAEGEFHIRANITAWQIQQAYLGEAAFDRLKVVDPKMRMVETSLGVLRLVKAISRDHNINFPIKISPPRSLNTLLVSHIPSNWSEEEIRMVLPSASVVDPIDFFLDTVSNEWRGETQVCFKNATDLYSAFSKLTACTDVFVGWEWSLCGKVTEDTLRSLGNEFGPVVGVRIQEKFLPFRSVLPGKEESRPFGFISLARYQDALAMASATVNKDGVAFHVKMSKKPITAFKRVPLGEGQDYIEAFIM